MITPAEYWDMLKKHDWTYMMSDDGSVYRSGKNTKTQPKAGQRVNPDIGTLTLEFTTVGPYPGYVNFIGNLEKNLRIMNVKKSSFLAPDDKINYQFQTTVETYWVK
jgi:hypothetical protein